MFQCVKSPILVLCAGLALASCQTRSASTTLPPNDYKTRHPIVVVEAAETLDIPVGLSTDALSPATHSAIAGFAQHFHEKRASAIQIMVPSGAANEVTATYLAGEVRRTLIQSGIPESRIEHMAYRSSNPEINAPIRLAFPTIKAKLTKQCGLWPEDLGKSHENRDYYNFGCATQQNLAAIIADPQDLLSPRAMTAADASRRDIIFDKYRLGEKTQSASTVEDAGQASEVGG